MGSSSPALSNMQFLVLLSAVALAVASPIPEEGMEAPEALAYVHDATGDVLSMIPLQLSLMSMMPLVTLLILPPLKPRLTSMTPQAMLQSPTSTRSPSPLLRHLPSLMPPTLTPTAPTPTSPLVPTSLLPLLPRLR